MREIVKPEDVERIDIKTYDLAVSGHDHTDIPGSYSAKMSIPYATAVALIFGKAGLQEFSEEVVNNGKVQELARRVMVNADVELSNAFPDIQAAIVTIITKDNEYTERVDFPKGEPENPLTDEEFRNRYDGLMEYAGVDRGVSSEVFDTVYNEQATVDELVKKLSNL